MRVSSDQRSGARDARAGVARARRCASARLRGPASTYAGIAVAWLGGAAADAGRGGACSGAWRSSGWALGSHRRIPRRARAVRWGRARRHPPPAPARGLRRRPPTALDAARDVARGARRAARLRPRLDRPRGRRPRPARPRARVGGRRLLPPRAVGVRGEAALAVPARRRSTRRRRSRCWCRARRTRCVESPSAIAADAARVGLGHAAGLAPRRLDRATSGEVRRPRRRRPAARRACCRPSSSTARARCRRPARGDVAVGGRVPARPSRRELGRGRRCCVRASPTTGRHGRGAGRRRRASSVVVVDDGVETGHGGAGAVVAALRAGAERAVRRAGGARLPARGRGRPARVATTT